AAGAAEAAAALLRAWGDLTEAEAAQRGVTSEWLAELSAARRAITVRIAGEQRWIAIEDAGRVRDALGVALPVGVPEAFTEPVADPLGDLVGRYARTHGPFHAADCARRLGLGPAVVADVLARLSATGRVVAGEFRPGCAGAEWCDAEVLRRLRRRSLARLRREVEPVPTEALARFLPAWQGGGGSGPAAGGRVRGGGAGGRGAVGRRRGGAGRGSAREPLTLPAGAAGSPPAMLDELTAAGEVLWTGAGGLPGNDGWVVLAPADTAGLVLPPPEEPSFTPVHRAVLEVLAGDQALFFRSLADRVAGLVADPVEDQALAAAVWDLVWAGLLGTAPSAPRRARAGAGQPTPRRRAGPARGRYGRARLGAGRPVLPTRTGPPTVAGRWWRLAEREPDPTRRAHALAEVLLDRHGVGTRGAGMAGRAPGGVAGGDPGGRGGGGAGSGPRRHVAGLPRRGR